MFNYTFCFFFRISNNELHRLVNEVFIEVVGLPTRHSERVFCSVSTQPPRLSLYRDRIMI